MLELKGVNSTYDKSHILHDVSFTVNDKEIVGLLGRNGVGKSTTLKSIMGIVRPKSGSIRV
jgi:branched-chain amino acid transport system ATP-binding protein